MVKYSAKNRKGSRKQSFKKRNYHKKMTAGGKTAAGLAVETGAPAGAGAGAVVETPEVVETEKETGAVVAETEEPAGTAEKEINVLVNMLSEACSETDEDKRKKQILDKLMDWLATITKQ